MGALKTKILSYSPEQYFTNEAAYTSSALTNYGSLTNTVAFSNTGGAPTLNSTGGPDGSGCWQFSTNPTAEQALRSFGSSSGAAAAYAVFMDNDYSAGGWFRIPALASGNTEPTVEIIRFGGTTTGTIVNLVLTGTNIGKLTLSNPSLTTSIRYDDGLWHYYSERYYSNGTNLIKERYLDGSLVSSGILEASNSLWYLTMADNNIINTNTISSPTYIEIAHVYASASASIDATAIGEIWTAGQALPTTDITITETPATATALQTEPTIAIVANDHVEITTSILVSATFPSNITAGGERNSNNEITGTLNASVEMINNVDVSTGSDASHSSPEMTASADIVEPLFARQPMTASAVFGNHTVYVTPNYYSLVKSNNPYSYFYDGLSTSRTVNGGYQTGTFARLYTQDFDSAEPMNLIGNGKSWRGAISFNSPTVETSFNKIIESRTFSAEMWVRPTLNNHFETNNYNQLVERGSATWLGSDHFGFGSYASSYRPDTSPTTRISVDNGCCIVVNNEIKIKSGSNVIIPNSWNHIVARVSPASGNNTLLELFVNGSIVASGSYNLGDLTAETTRIGAGVSEADGQLDEWATYPTLLTNSEIAQRYEFINTSSPNRTIGPVPFESLAESGSHNFIINSNAVIQATAITATSLIVNPSIIAGRSKEILATPLEASGVIASAIVKYGVTIQIPVAIAYAEAVNAYRLSDVYRSYVQANITPYRYVTFDGNNSYLDYGTDADYSVAPVTIGGTIVNPDLGINGKSAKTAGTSYITDGVILKESEWDDTWGTGANDYHSSFWFQRAEDDASTTGLRVLWNLNGYLNNQHVLLYQYQGKLHMQFNNASGTYIEQSTASNIDLFDYQRHFVAINFDHTGGAGGNNTVKLYVDSVLVMTVALGSYNGLTVNYASSQSPNSEEHNHPRLGIGCLITPFADTALPVVPANTKIYVDDVIWAKSSLTQTLATNLFNTMPVKGQARIFATPLTASDEFVMPAIATNSLISTSSFDASAELLDIESVFADRESISNADIIDVTAEFVNPRIFENKVISADVFVANAIFNDSGVLITIPGGPMLATAILSKENIKVNNKFISLAYTAYTNYLIKDSSAAAITRFREVK
jgi:hypothetical protein